MECTTLAPARQTDGSTTAFLSAIFAAGDYALFRPIETWTENGQKKSRVDYKGVVYASVNGDAKTLDYAIRHQNTRAETTKANVFYGVCPRFGIAGQYDQAWQIRVIRTLWTDVDHCTVDEARERCTAAQLPEPSIIVGSGNGAHLYWLLSEPYLIDDVGEPQPVFTEFTDQGEGKKKKVRKFLTGDGDTKVYIDGKDKRNALSLSPKAQYVQDILAGIAEKIGGDHTTDLSRLLRVPGTLNRKDQRNGREPVPCTLVECDPQRRYTIADFAKYAEASPDRVQRETIAKVKLPASRKLSAPKLDRFHTLLLVCDTAPVGTRSDADFALCAWAIENGIDAAKVWTEAQHVGKFKEAGERYFDRTWEKAAGQTQQKIYDKAVAKTQRKQTGTPAAEDFPLTDTGNAERFALQHGDDVRYCYRVGQVARLGRHAMEDRRRRHGRSIGQADGPRSILREAADEPDDARRKALIDFAKSSESVARRDRHVDAGHERTAHPDLARRARQERLDSELSERPRSTFTPASYANIDARTTSPSSARSSTSRTPLCPTWLATLDTVLRRRPTT